MAQLAIAAMGALALGPVGLGLTTAGTGFMLGSLAYSLMAPGQKSYGPRLNDLKVTGTEYGAAIPWVAGSPRVAGQIIWASDRRETATEQEQGKGGGATSTTYTYDVDLLILLSENEISGIKRIWSNGEMVFDGTTAQEGLWLDLRVYTGTEDQLPDPTYEAAVGLGNAPAYRGMGTVVIQGLQLGNSGNIPNLTFELAAGAYTLVDKLIHDFDGVYDQGKGAFCNRDHYPVSPIDQVPINTIVPSAGPGAVLTISKTLSVLPGRPVSFTLYHDDSAKLFVDGEQIALTGSLEYISYASLTPAGTSLQVVMEVTENNVIAPLNYRYAAFRVTQRRPGYKGSDGPPVSVEDVISALMFRCGYDVTDYVVGEVDAGHVIRALAVGQVSNTRSALEPIQQACFLECSSVEQIVFRERAVQPVATIPFSDLGMATGSGGEDDPLGITLGNDLELPAQLALSYANMAGDYQAATEFSDRLLAGQQSTESMQSPLGLLPAEAKAIVDGLLMDRVASLATATLKLPLKYAYLEPGDVVNAINSDGRVYRLRVQSKTDALPIIELQCVLDDVGAIQSAAVTDTGYVDTNTVIQPAGTLLELLDIPILRDADDSPGYYVAVAPQRVAETDKWPGAVVAQAWDDINYSQVLKTTAQCVMGTAITALDDWQGGPVFDESSTVTVQVSGELESSTREAMLLDDTINALLLGKEILRFRSAALLSPGTYLLSGLLRGQRGTEWAMASHESDERCVLLGNDLRRIGSQTNEIGLERQIKAVTLGRFLSDGTPKDFVDTAVALKPFSPAGLRALADADGVHLSWQRRTRLAYRYGGVAPVVPLGEAAEKYRVQMWLGSMLLRSIDVDAPRYLYPTEQQIADGVGLGILRVEVAQVSANVGAGYPASIGIGQEITPGDLDAEMDNYLFDGEQFIAAHQSDGYTHFFGSPNGVVFEPLGKVPNGITFSKIEEGIAKGASCYASFPKHYAATSNTSSWYSITIPDFSIVGPPDPWRIEPISGALPLCIAWDEAGSRFVRVMDNKTITTSEDGLLWSELGAMVLPEPPGGWTWYTGMSMNLFKAGSHWYALHSGLGNKFQSDSTMLMRSTDLISWELCHGTGFYSPPGGGEQWDYFMALSVAKRGGTFIVVATGRRTPGGVNLALMLRSTDGLNFSIVYESADFSSGHEGFTLIKPVGVAGFVAVGAESGLLVSADDGVSWTPRAMALPPTNLRSNGLTVVGERATGAGGRAQLWFTHDGLNWQKSTAREADQ